MVGDTTMADTTVGLKTETITEAVTPVGTTITVGTIIITGTEETTTIAGIATERISIPVTGDNLEASASRVAPLALFV